ncbi:hypothetical protein SEPCBS119000_003836 [Sporothrix epigloea]|uniref:Transposase n=1 Tax=Sporothrix epigloea TaxID=1892477 RepID=A0ABP0DQY5_9PEZI
MTRHLTAEQTKQVRDAYFIWHRTRREIQTTLGITASQIRLAISPNTEKQRRGRKANLSAEETQQLVDFVTKSKVNRQMSYLQLSTALFNGQYGLYTIRNTLRREGFHRGVAQKEISRA